MEHMDGKSPECLRIAEYLLHHRVQSSSWRLIRLAGRQRYAQGSDGNGEADGHGPKMIPMTPVKKPTTTPAARNDAGM